jgi:hypothetical protein
MIVQPSKKFKEAPKAHEEIVELEKRLAEKKKELVEKEEVEPHDREIIKEVLKEKMEKPAPPKITLPTTPPSTSKVVVKKAKELKGEKKERQIQLLTDLAFEKGVIHATEVAKKLEDPYILDEFHDTLVDELYNYLVEQGKLKQI